MDRRQPTAHQEIDTQASVSGRMGARRHPSSKITRALAITTAFAISQMALGNTVHSAANGLTAYAPVKKPFGTVSPRDEKKWGFPFPMPHRGALYAEGSFLSRVASYVLVDFDRHSASIFTTVMRTLPDGEVERPLASRHSRKLSEDEEGRLITVANNVWNPPPGTTQGGPVVEDSVCDIQLYDGDDVLQVSCPYDTEPLLQIIQRIRNR